MGWSVLKAEFFIFNIYIVVVVSTTCEATEGMRLYK
jgi:hypothetical protein